MNILSDSNQYRQEPTPNKDSDSNQYRQEPTPNKDKAQRVFYEAPFAYQDKPVLRAMRSMFKDGTWSRHRYLAARALYCALTELASDHQAQKFKEPIDRLALYSGLSKRAISPALRDLETVGFIHLRRTRAKCRLGLYEFELLSVAAEKEDQKPTFSRCRNQHVEKSAEGRGLLEAQVTESPTEGNIVKMQKSTCRLLHNNVEVNNEEIIEYDERHRAVSFNELEIRLREAGVDDAALERLKGYTVAVVERNLAYALERRPNNLSAFLLKAVQGDWAAGNARRTWKRFEREREIESEAELRRRVKEKEPKERRCRICGYFELYKDDFCYDCWYNYHHRLEECVVSYSADMILVEAAAG